MTKYLIYAAIIYLILVNIIGFASMGWDKRKAKKQEWRVKERTLFLWAVIGGSLGSILGMRVFHHKTKHWYFVIGMPLILLAQLALVGFLIYKF